MREYNGEIKIAQIYQSDKGKFLHDALYDAAYNIGFFNGEKLGDRDVLMVTNSSQNNSLIK